ncbi:MAG: glycosyltransferase family 4 protein [Bryobacteraceae bacterium]|nr:glycosyltransferase family 4 protein [Bryobacteraceae bacterium]
MKRPAGDSGAKESALLLTPEAPYPMAGGGAIRTASLVEYLGRRYQLDVILFEEPDSTATAFPPGLVRNLLRIPLPPHGRSVLARGLRNARRLLRGAPPLADRFSGFDSQIAAALNGARYRTAVIEHFWCAPYLHALSPHAGAVILDLHNVESELHLTKASASRGPMRFAFRRFAGAYRALEEKLLPDFARVLVTSPEDEARVRAIAPSSSTAVYPNALPVHPLPAREEEDCIAFSGNLGYHPNVDAVRFFRREIWPLLRGAHPGLRWNIIGKNPGYVRPEAASDPRIRLTGPVPDALEALASAKVCVVPLRSGSGTRFKILEAWAAGRAVVSTPLGAEGLGATSGRELLLAQDPASFAAAVSRLLASPGLRREIAEAGRRLYCERYTWPAAWQSLDRLLP